MMGEKQAYKEKDTSLNKIKKSVSKVVAAIVNTRLNFQLEKKVCRNKKIQYVVIKSSHFEVGLKA